MAKSAKKVMRSAPRKSKSVKLIEEGHIGRETTDWSSVPAEKYEARTMETMRHYGYFYDKKSYLAWTIAWIKDNRPSDLKDYKAADDWRTSSTLASLCKMERDGCVLSKSAKSFLETNLDNVIAYGKTVKAVIDPEASPPVKRKSPSELLGEKTNEFIGEIEGFVDEFTQGTLDKDWSIYNEMIKLNSAAQTAHDTIKYYKGCQEELRELIEDKTEDLVEGYDNFTPKQQKEFYKFVSNIITDCEKFLVSKKATRKPRTKKATPAHKQVAKVLYLPSSSEFKIASVSPEKMVGAESMYLFNTKTRVMKYLVSDRRDGFLVKGSTVSGFCAERSFKKMLRKPEEYIALLGKGSKAKSLKELKALKTKENTTDGRINRDTIILKVLQ